MTAKEFLAGLFKGRIVEDDVPSQPEGETISLGMLIAAGISETRAQAYLDPLNRACCKFEINTPHRIAAFLATIAYESDDFKATSEYWGPTAYQLKYPGGQLYKGRGLIQVTGEANYRATAAFFGVDMNEIANWLQSPEGAAQSAGQWWYANGCNALADAGNFTGVTRKVNGPRMLGLPQRLEIYGDICQYLGIA